MENRQNFTIRRYVSKLVYHLIAMIDRQILRGAVLEAPREPHPGRVSVISQNFRYSDGENKRIYPTNKAGIQRATLNKRSGKKIQFLDNMNLMDRLVLFSGEVVATAILVFLGCMGCVTGIAGGSIPHEQISLTFGLAVMVAVQVFGHVSGSHINPIVTVAAVTLGNIPLIQVPIYFAGQMFGALAGFGLLKLSTPSEFMGNNITISSNGTISKSPGVCSPGLHPSISPFQGFLVEFLATLILALVCCGVWDHRNSDKHDSVAIRFGLTIAVLAMAAGPYTGANMNPARSFAPALFNGDWNNHWLYWLGPLLAGFVGALIYRLIFAKDKQSTHDLHEGIPLNDNNKA